MHTVASEEEARVVMAEPGHHRSGIQRSGIQPPRAVERLGGLATFGHQKRPSAQGEGRVASRGGTRSAQGERNRAIPDRAAGGRFLTYLGRGQGRLHLHCLETPVPESMGLPSLPCLPQEGLWVPVTETPTRDSLSAEGQLRTRGSRTPPEPALFLLGHTTLGSSPCAWHSDRLSTAERTGLGTLAPLEFRALDAVQLEQRRIVCGAGGR